VSGPLYYFCLNLGSILGERSLEDPRFRHLPWNDTLGISSAVIGTLKQTGKSSLANYMICNHPGPTRRYDWIRTFCNQKAKIQFARCYSCNFAHQLAWVGHPARPSKACLELFQISKIPYLVSFINRMVWGNYGWELHISPGGGTASHNHPIISSA
jgi:hypothetical protein